MQGGAAGCILARMFRNKLVPLAAALAWVAPVMGAEWLTDMEAARQKAAAEHKAVLASFTGSDWCGACKYLHRELLATPAFEAYAEEKFVLLEIDCPHGNSMSEEQKKVNNALAAAYHVRAFPTVLVLNAQGEAAGGFLGSGYKLPEARAVLDAGLGLLAELQQAKALQGQARVDALVALLDKVPEDVRGCAVGIEDAIIAADPEDRHGIARRRAVARQRAEISTRRAGIRHTDPKDMLAMVQEYQATVMPENRPAVLELKFSALVLMADSKEELEQVKATLMADLEPLRGNRDAETLRRNIESSMKNPDFILAQVRQIRARRQEEARAAGK